MLFNNIDSDVLPSVSHDRSTDGQAVCGWRLFKRSFILRKEQSKSAKKNLPVNFPLLAASYNNISWVFERMDNCSKALSSYNRALPLTHPYVLSVQKRIGIISKKL